MNPDDQSRLITVLVRARNPANIGAVARAMHDLGYSGLRVVNEYPVPFEAAKSAVHASSVLHAATQPASLAQAVADCTLVLGTTAVGARRLEHPLYLLHEAVPLVQTHLAVNPEARVALLFGSEKTGLSNDELSHCHALVTIPMHNPTQPGEATRHLSMNLGQAAAVCLYMLARPSIFATEAAEVSPQRVVRAEAGCSDFASADGDLATGADLERIAELLSEVMARSGYSRRNPANSREAAVRRLVRRMANSHADAAVWSGILRQLLHKLQP